MSINSTQVPGAFASSLSRISGGGSGDKSSENPAGTSGVDTSDKPGKRTSGISPGRNTGERGVSPSNPTSFPFPPSTPAPASGSDSSERGVNASPRETKQKDESSSGSTSRDIQKSKKFLENQSKTEPSSSGVKSPSELSSEERQQVQKLRQIDQRVRAHEQAHLSAAGSYAEGGPNFEFKKGPDGKRYAVSGSVQLDTSKAKTPEKTIQKMRRIRKAALAPANPSPQDRKVASQATKKMNQARQEQRQNETDSAGTQNESEISEPTSRQNSAENSGEPSISEINPENADQSKRVGEASISEFSNSAGEKNTNRITESSSEDRGVNDPSDNGTERDRQERSRFDSSREQNSLKGLELDIVA